MPVLLQKIDSFQRVSRQIVVLVLQQEKHPLARSISRSSLKRKWTSLAICSTRCELSSEFVQNSPRRRKWGKRFLKNRGKLAFVVEVRRRLESARGDKQTSCSTPSLNLWLNYVFVFGSRFTPNLRSRLDKDWFEVRGFSQQWNSAGFRNGRWHVWIEKSLRAEKILTMF